LRPTIDSRPSTPFRQLAARGDPFAPDAVAVRRVELRAARRQREPRHLAQPAALLLDRQVRAKRCADGQPEHGTQYAGHDTLACRFLRAGPGRRWIGHLAFSTPQHMAGPLFRAGSRPSTRRHARSWK